MGLLASKLKVLRVSNVLGKERPQLEYGGACPLEVVYALKRRVAMGLVENAEKEWAERYVPWGKSGRIETNDFSSVEAPLDMEGPCGELEIDEVWIAVPKADGDAGDLIAWRAKPDRQTQETGRKGDAKWIVRSVEFGNSSVDDDRVPVQRMGDYRIAHRELPEHAAKAVAWYQSYAKRRSMERGQMTFF